MFHLYEYTEKRTKKANYKGKGVRLMQSGHLIHISRREWNDITHCSSLHCLDLPTIPKNELIELKIYIYILNTKSPQYYNV
jgi:hypothetical protein